jgi:hypothetical protein
MDNPVRFATLVRILGGNAQAKSSKRQVGACRIRKRKLPKRSGYLHENM